MLNKIFSFKVSFMKIDFEYLLLKIALVHVYLMSD